MYGTHGPFGASSPRQGGDTDLTLCCDETLWLAAERPAAAAAAAAGGSAAAAAAAAAFRVPPQPPPPLPLWRPAPATEPCATAAAAARMPRLAPTVADAVGAPTAGLTEWEQEGADLAPVAANTGMRIVWEPLRPIPEPPPSASLPLRPVTATAAGTAATAATLLPLPSPPPPPPLLQAGRLGAAAVEPPFALDLSAPARPTANELLLQSLPPPRPPRPPPLQLSSTPRLTALGHQADVDAHLLLLHLARAAAGAGAPAAPARDDFVLQLAAAAAGLPGAQIAPQRQLPDRHFSLPIRTQPHQYLQCQHSSPQLRLPRPPPPLQLQLQLQQQQQLLQLQQWQQQQLQLQQWQPLDLDCDQAADEAALPPPSLPPRPTAPVSQRLPSFPSAATSTSSAAATGDGARGGEMPPPLPLPPTAPPPQPLPPSQAMADAQQRTASPSGGLTAAAAPVPAFAATRPSHPNHCAQCGSMKTGGCWRKGWPLGPVGQTPEVFANLCNRCGLRYQRQVLAQSAAAPPASAPSSGDGDGGGGSGDGGGGGGAAAAAAGGVTGRKSSHGGAATGVKRIRQTPPGAGGGSAPEPTDAAAAAMARGGDAADPRVMPGSETTTGGRKRGRGGQQPAAAAPTSPVGDGTLRDAAEGSRSLTRGLTGGPSSAAAAAPIGNDDGRQPQELSGPATGPSVAAAGGGGGGGGGGGKPTLSSWPSTPPSLQMLRPGSESSLQELDLTRPLRNIPGPRPPPELQSPPQRSANGVGAHHHHHHHHRQQQQQQQQDQEQQQQEQPVRRLKLRLQTAERQQQQQPGPLQPGPSAPLPLPPPQKQQPPPQHQPEQQQWRSPKPSRSQANGGGPCGLNRAGTTAAAAAPAASAAAAAMVAARSGSRFPEPRGVVPPRSVMGPEHDLGRSRSRSRHTTAAIRRNSSSSDDGGGDGGDGSGEMRHRAVGRIVVGRIANGGRHLPQDDEIDPRGTDTGSDSGAGAGSMSGTGSGSDDSTASGSSGAGGSGGRHFKRPLSPPRGRGRGQSPAARRIKSYLPGPMGEQRKLQGEAPAVRESGPEQPPWVAVIPATVEVVAVPRVLAAALPPPLQAAAAAAVWRAGPATAAAPVAMGAAAAAAAATGAGAPAPAAAVASGWRQRSRRKATCVTRAQDPIQDPDSEKAPNKIQIQIQDQGPRMDEDDLKAVEALLLLSGARCAHGPARGSKFYAPAVAGVLGRERGSPGAPLAGTNVHRSHPPPRRSNWAAATAAARVPRSGRLPAPAAAQGAGEAPGAAAAGGAASPESTRWGAAAGPTIFPAAVGFSHGAAGALRVQQASGHEVALRLCADVVKAPPRQALPGTTATHGPTLTHGSVAAAPVTRLAAADARDSELGGLRSASGSSLGGTGCSGGAKGDTEERGGGAAVRHCGMGQWDSRDDGGRFEAAGEEGCGAPARWPTEVRAAGGGGDGDGGEGLRRGGATWYDVPIRLVAPHVALPPLPQRKRGAISTTSSLSPSLSL
ncbi:hypothetical protein PLESTM_000458400 [Pleodorina starrii]|nr:hypothetical protein PLESTM_000458400 [Pleodorina starrii]